MKAKEIVAQIVAQGSEYGELTEWWELLANDSSPETTDIWGRIYELFRALEEVIDVARKNFLRQVARSCLNGTKANKIYFGMTNIDAAKDAFDRQVSAQMPLYKEVMDLITSKEEKMLLAAN